MFSKRSGQRGARWQISYLHKYSPYHPLPQALSVLTHGYQISQAVSLTTAIFKCSLLQDQMKCEFSISHLRCFECLLCVTLSGQLWGPAIHRSLHSAIPSLHYSHSSETQINRRNNGYHTSRTEAQASLMGCRADVTCQFEVVHSNAHKVIAGFF
jgi:hypothetical protein